MSDESQVNMRSTDKMPRGTAQGIFRPLDYLIVLSIFLGALLLRIPFRSRFAYHWDSAQFALAVEHYDWRVSQPHVPGFFLYIMIGRLLNLVIGDPHASLVWLSVFVGAALAALGYSLGTAMFGRGCGIVTAVILAVSPLCWFHSEIALTNIVDAALVTATVVACWQAIRKGGTWLDVGTLAVLVALTAGVRQQSVPGLLPAWLYALSRFSAPRWPKIAAGIALAGLLCLAWFIPMVAASGGLGLYLQALRAKALFNAPESGLGGGFGVLTNNTGMIVDVCWVGLLGGGIIAVGALFRFVFGDQPETKREFYAGHREQLRLLAWWILPMLVFGAVTFMTMPGYVLSYFPGVAVLAGLAVWRLAVRPSSPAGRMLAAAVCFLCVGVLDVVVFVSQPHWADRLLTGLPLTARHIREHDQQLSHEFAVIRARYRPDDILICHAGEFFLWGFRQFEYHLPEYRNLLLTPDASVLGDRGKELWLGYMRKTDFLGFLDTSSYRTLLLVVPPGGRVEMFGPYVDVSRAERVDQSAGMLYAIAQQSNKP